MKTWRPATSVYAYQASTDTFVRLNDLGVDSFSFADSLQGILAQRLVRKLCASCKQSRPMLAPRLREITDDYQRALPPGHALRDTQTLHEQWRQRHAKGGMMQDFQAPGCDHCGNTGYVGRMPLQELLAATPAVRLLVQKRARPAEILALALSEGMRSLRQDGIEKVLAGQTSLAEVRASTND